MLISILAIYILNMVNDLVPTLRTQKWYEAFKNFDDDDFESMVEDYMRKENTYPPSSPSSILEYANKKDCKQTQIRCRKRMAKT